MPIEIGSVKLSRIHRVASLESAGFVYHKVPGMAGNAIQDAGRDSVRLLIEGIFYGPKAKESLDQLRGVYLKREATDFIADVVDKSYVGKVVLERFEVVESAEEPDQFSYSLIVTEYAQSAASTSNAAAVNSSIQADAALQMEIAALPDALALGSLPEITDPFTPLKTSLDSVAEASKTLTESFSGLKSLFGI